MASIKFIKSLKNDNFNLIDVLSTFVFENTPLREYKTTLVFNKGDLAVKQNDTTSKFEVYRCKVDNTTGMFDPMKWEKFDIRKAADTVLLSSTAPDNRENEVWYQIKKDKGMFDPDAF